MFIYSYDIGWLQHWIPPSLRISSSSFSMCRTIQRSLLKSSFHLDRTLWRLELVLFAGALMWSCIERSVAPSPAGSTTASCDVWAEAVGTGVQEAPVPQCSPSSSPVLRKEGKIRTIKTKDAIKNLTRPFWPSYHPALFRWSPSCARPHLGLRRCDPAGWSAFADAACSCLELQAFFPPLPLSQSATESH